MAQLVKQMVHKQGDLKSDPRTHTEKPGVVVCSFNPSTQEVYPWGLLASQPHPQGERLCL